MNTSRNKIKRAAVTITDLDWELARHKVYEAMADVLWDAVMSQGELRKVALAYHLTPPNGLTRAHWNRGDGTAAAIEQMDLEAAVENLVGLVSAWDAMSIDDDSIDGGVGNLLEDFVDVMNDPQNADDKSKRNLAKILEVADKLRAHLASKALAGE